MGEVIKQVQEFSDARQKHEWTNMVYILNQGFVFHGEANAVRFANEAIEGIQSLQMQGRPDREGFGLFTFYSILMELLRGTQTTPAAIDAYFSLPLVSNDRSYRFLMGMFGEFGACAKHGDFPRKISTDKLDKVTNWCRTSTPINWVRAHHIAYGQPGDEAA